MSTAKKLRDVLSGAAQPDDEAVAAPVNESKPRKPRLKIVVKELGQSLGNLVADNAHAEREQMMQHIPHIKSEADVDEYVSGYRETLSDRNSRETGEKLKESTIKSRCSELRSAIALLSGVQMGTIVVEEDLEDMSLRELAETARKKGLTRGKPKAAKAVDPFDVIVALADVHTQYNGMLFGDPVVDIAIVSLLDKVQAAYLECNSILAANPTQSN